VYELTRDPDPPDICSVLQFAREKRVAFFGTRKFYEALRFIFYIQGTEFGQNVAGVVKNFEDVFEAHFRAVGMSAVAVRALVRGEGDVVICRDYEVACGLACMSCAHAAIEEFERKFDATPSSVLMSTRKQERRGGIPKHLRPGDVNLLNLCGKINHACNTDNNIFNAGCVPLLSKVRDGFGVRLSAATVYGNFVTSPQANTTLFRGCKRCSDVERAIGLIFKENVVHEVVIHMVVAMTVLPHAVSMGAGQIVRALEERAGWAAQRQPSLEENVYMQPIQISHEGKKVLVHVYATGAMFFFITCTERTVMEAGSELQFVKLCREIYACVERVC